MEATNEDQYAICISLHISPISLNSFKSIYLYMSNWKLRITTNPAQCGGRPCISSLRIRVVDIIDLLAAGLTQEQVLEELPDLEPGDIEAALKYAGSKLDHPIIAACW